MTKTKLIFIGLAVALVGFLFAGPASADEHGPSISVDPSSVEAAGSHTLTVTGSGWSVAATNVLPCNIPEGVDAGAMSDAEISAHCSDMANLGLGNMVGGIAIADGGFEATITLDVPEQGVFIVSGDSAQTESANVVWVSVGMMQEMPATGVNTSMLVIIGSGIALAGVMVFGLSRRLRTL